MIPRSWACCMASASFNVDLSSPVARHWMCSDLLGKASTLGILKDEEGIPEVDPDFVNQHDVGVFQRSDRLCLDAEPG